MKKKLFSLIAMALAVTLAFSGCFNWLLPKQELTDAALVAEKIIDFKDGANPEVLFSSDGWTNGDVFNVVWKDHNVIYENGIMRLTITEEKASAWLNDAEVEYDYTAGEARTQNYYHYGDYMVSMKPSANPGTASTFFTCTGPYDTKFVLDANGDYVLDENGQRVTVANPHDEIDIEFLGKDTTKVQFNFFVNGVGGNEYMHDLGFDASEGFHEYGYRWTPDSITWFVDGQPVYKVTTDKSVQEGKNVRIVEAIPSTPGRILTNYWCGNKDAVGWMGKYNGSVNDNGTQYQWIATSAAGAPLNPSEEPPVDDTTEINWAEIAAIAPTFPSAEKYVVAIDGNKANVTYTDVGGSEYKPIEMDIAEASVGKNFIYLKVTNNGTEMVNVRVNVIDQALVDAGAQNMATNVYATMDGVAVNTDLVWGGSFFDIAPGQTAELVVKFTGVVEKLQLMLDSSRNDAVLRSGDVTVEDIKFAVVGEVEIPCEHIDADNDAKCDNCGEDMVVPPSPPENPVSGNLTLNFGDFTTTIGGNVTDGYGVNVDENNNIHVEYTNIVGNSYKNIWANVAAIAGTKNVFSVKVTNPGSAAVKVRIDIESQTQVNANTTCCNLSATMDGNGVYTDLEWGGTTFVIEPGVTAVLEVTYDASKLPTNVKFMIDSCQWDDGTSHAGEIIITDLAFSGEYTPGEGGDEPIDPPAPTVAFTDLYVEFKTENNYTLVSPDTYANSVRVTYTDIAQNSWSNINIWVEDKSADCSVFSMKLTNHGTADVSVWVQMKDAAGAELINQNKVIAAGAEETVTFNYTGTAQMIFFFIDSTHEAAAGPNSGDITISELKLGKIAAEEEPKDPTPEVPVEGEYLSFTANDCYTLSAASDAYVNSLQVTYTAVSDNTYQNVNTWIQDKAADKTAFGVTIKNNGAETVTITVKLEAAGAVALAEQKMVIAAGETQTILADFAGAAEMLYFFIDSGWAETTATHAGDVTISGIHFQ